MTYLVCCFAASLGIIEPLKRQQDIVDKLPVSGCCLL